MFLLGTPPRSAKTAARKGLGYGFAAHTNPDVAAGALRLCREKLTPARAGSRPYVILGLKVVVGEDDAHAETLAPPWYLALARHRTANPSPMTSIEQSQRHRWTDGERSAEALVDRRADAVGGPEGCAIGSPSSSQRVSPKSDRLNRHVRAGRPAGVVSWGAAAMGLATARDHPEPSRLIRSGRFIGQFD